MYNMAKPIRIVGNNDNESQVMRLVDDSSSSRFFLHVCFLLSFRFFKKII